MAKNTKKKDTKPKEPVTNCDLKNINIESLIRTICGQKVMVDFDLAMLYGVQTKALNQAVKRNIERFPDDFMFQLTKEELDSLRSQIVTANPAEYHSIEEWRSQFVTSNFARMGLRRPPYAFTRNGIGMLSSVLRSETAVEVNIRIMRAFTAIPDFVNNNVLISVRTVHNHVSLRRKKRHYCT